MTPNQVTSASLVLVIVAGVLFARGEFGWGLVAGWIMTFLDTVDGKLARVTITSTKLGNVFDHGIDLIHPPFWYLAWGMGLALEPAAIAGIPLSLDLLGDPRRLRRRPALRRRVPALHRALLDLHVASVRLVVPADRGAAQSEHDHAHCEPRARPTGPGPAGGRRVDGVVDGAASAAAAPGRAREMATGKRSGRGSPKSARRWTSKPWRCACSLTPLPPRARRDGQRRHAAGRHLGARFRAAPRATLDRHPAQSSKRREPACAPRRCSDALAAHPGIPCRDVAGPAFRRRRRCAKWRSAVSTRRDQRRRRYRARRPRHRSSGASPFPRRPLSQCCAAVPPT